MSEPEHGPGTPRPALWWPAEWHAAYLDSRPDETSRYNPAAEYGDPDWREPASDVEAAARTTWLAENTPPTPGWPSRPLTEVENALEDAQERAVLADRAHDPDPYAWAEFQRLQALDRLAALPAHDALDDLPRDRHGAPDTLAARGWLVEDQIVSDHRAEEAAFDGRDAGDHVDGRGGPFTDTQGRWWPSTGAWAAGTGDSNRAHDIGYREGPDDPGRLGQRIEELRASLGAEAVERVPDEGEQRREQLARWHEDDQATRIDADSRDSGDDGVGVPGWDR